MDQIHSARADRLDRFPPRFRWAIWLTGLAVWTYLLTVPIDWLPPSLRFHGNLTSPFLSWGKIGHFSAYATLAALVPMLPIRFRQQLAVWALLSAHAFATELIQAYVPTRTGCWRDVGIDHLGFAAGLLLSCLWPRRSTPPESK